MAKHPFQLAGEIFGHDEVMEVIDDTLIIRYSDTLVIIAEALVISTIDERIDLDGIHFLSRRLSSDACGGWGDDG